MSRTDAEIEQLATRLADERGRRVVFVSHCLLNQNVRYLGGAWAAGIVPDAVERFTKEGVGLYQMPCPEQAAWGGVMKRFILRFYGAQGNSAYRFRGLLLPLFRLYTRAVYRRLASRTARHIADYARSGFQVIGIVGVSDSPSCGVLHTLDINRSLHAVASFDLNGIDRQTFNERAVQACVVEGEGLYVKALRRQLWRRGLTVPFLEHRPSMLPRA
jgi:predicted secreted protein